MRDSSVIPAENSSTTVGCWQFVAHLATILCALIVATSASGQQVVPFGDVPATADFS